MGGVSRRNHERRRLDVRGRTDVGRDSRRSARKYGDVMSWRKATAKRSQAKTAEIIHLPHDDFSFEACDLKRSLPEKYDSLRPYVVAVDGLIRMDASTLRLRGDVMRPELGIHVG